jgi:hypothetical protein
MQVIMRVNSQVDPFLRHFQKVYIFECEVRADSFIRHLLSNISDVIDRTKLLLLDASMLLAKTLGVLESRSFHLRMDLWHGPTDMVPPHNAGEINPPTQDHPRQATARPQRLGSR